MGTERGTPLAGRGWGEALPEAGEDSMAFGSKAAS